MYPYNARRTLKGRRTVCLSTLRQTININIQFTFTTKLSKSQFYSNKHIMQVAHQLGTPSRAQSTAQSTIQFLHAAEPRQAAGEQSDAASRQTSKHSSGDAAASEHSQALGIHRCSNLFKLFVSILTNVTYFPF